jgi:hypothetical protein
LHLGPLWFRKQSSVQFLDPPSGPGRLPSFIQAAFSIPITRICNQFETTKPEFCNDMVQRKSFPSSLGRAGKDRILFDVLRGGFLGFSLYFIFTHSLSVSHTANEYWSIEITVGNSL